jgi:hypothetical protein
LTGHSISDLYSYIRIRLAINSRWW